MSSRCDCNILRYFSVPQPEFLGALVEFFSARPAGPLGLNATTGENTTDAMMPPPLKNRPFFLGPLIDVVKGQFPDALGDKFEAYVYATAVVLASAFNVVLMHPYLLSQMHLGMKLRVAMCSMIYRKSLRLSKNALGQTTVGQVVNLLSNDVGRMDIAIIFLHFLWVGPIETIAVTYFMYCKVNLLETSHKSN